MMQGSEPLFFFGTQGLRLQVGFRDQGLVWFRLEGMPPDKKTVNNQGTSNQGAMKGYIYIYIIIHTYLY